MSGFSEETTPVVTDSSASAAVLPAESSVEVANVESTNENSELAAVNAVEDAGMSQVKDLLAKYEAMDPETLTPQQLVHLMQLKDWVRQKQRYDRAMEKQKMVDTKEHKFWNTQPVLPLNAEVTGKHGPITENTVDQVRPEPYKMPAGFEWCTIDMSNPEEVAEFYKLLSDNYVEDDECMFRFDYSIDFLKWALTPPGYIPDWIVGVRSTSTGRLMGSITAIPANIRAYSNEIPMAEINFLCVHKKLRSKRLAPVLIKEITRRVNLTDRWQAVYTAGVVLPKPLGRCRYYHRSLNPKKLVDVRFSSVPSGQTLASHIKKLKLPSRPTNPDLRPMVAADAPKVTALLNSYLKKKAQLAQVFTEDEIRHILTPVPGVVDTYVLEGPNGKLTDLLSFYHLPSTIIGNRQHSVLRAVYSFYNVPGTMSPLELFENALILASNGGADVFNALDLSENRGVFDELKFGPGDGFLHYYLYNWRAPEMPAEKIGMVLL